MSEFDTLASYLSVAPEIGLTILLLIVLAFSVARREVERAAVPYIAGFGMIALAALPLIFAPGDANSTIPEGLYWGGMIRYDVLAQVFRVMILLAGGITALMASGVRGVGRRGEFYIVIIVATLGMSLMSASADLVMVFVALETTSIPLYILAAFKRDDTRSAESGIKYFLFGSFASAIMLYGLSLLYGFTGQTNIYQLAAFMGSDAFANNLVPVLASMVLVVVGFGFKVSAVPFHFWTPDVYEGAPTPVTGYVSVASKAASFALLVRFFVAVYPETLALSGESLQNFWIQLMAVFAVLSMTLGNVLALSQKNIKRLLAYSSIAQAGYTLIGVAAIQSQELSIASVGFYMFMYTFTNLAAFTVVILFSEATGSETIADLAGLNRRSPWLALAMTIALLSLAGIPPTAGFFGKFFVFNAAVRSGLTWLAVVGVLNAIVALYYYLVVIKVMYVDRSEDEDKPIPVGRQYVWVLWATSLIVIVLGTVGAQTVYDWAARGAMGLFT
ncbi:MAG: NADH-quinone oxidoreductase subunit N [Chloroflexi bacterium]|nr:MAG: NADH-quinone oxidoreductase subunit N [Phototrophicales bacterium]RMF79426.1 MAG: NADH-quinone oxidoreductase subunit N [Chloroflexota bacterium]